jgi:hypothetical protein
MEFLRLIAAFILFLASLVHPQAAIDPSGHWEGAVQIPNMEMKIEIDLTKNSKGELAGTFGQPAQNLKGFPLSTLVADGASVHFVIKASANPATFDGTIDGDGKSITGEVKQGEYTVPFTLVRTGEARIAATPKSAPIGKQLEGTWNGTLEVDGKPMRLVVKMANQPDGTAAGTVMSPDGSGTEIPIAMTHKASTVTIDVVQVGASFSGELNAAGTELTGTWTQQSLALPLTLRRAATASKE